MKKKRTPKTTPKTNVADLARLYCVAPRTIARWRAAGAPLTDPKEMETWLCARRQVPAGALPSLAEARLAETLERVRRLRIANERDEGTLVDRGWVCSKIAIMCGELKCLEHRSLEEHPLRLAAAGHDVAQCRSVLRGVWGQLHDMLQSLGESLKEEDPE